MNSIYTERGVIKAMASLHDVGCEVRGLIGRFSADDPTDEREVVIKRANLFIYEAIELLDSTLNSRNGED